MKTACNILIILFLALSVGCRDDLSENSDMYSTLVEKKVAVVLPAGHGLDLRWQRRLALYSANLERAFRNRDVRIRLKFEFYDETTDNLATLADSLASCDDIYAVIGGLYSSDADMLTSRFVRVGKTIFTLATSESIVRGYASSGYLWAMTETDITQCEVLLAKAINYGGKSVALIAKENDPYGASFIDWFPFQARELGLKNEGVFVYGEATLHDNIKRAMHSGADYLICVPSEIEEIGPVYEAALAEMHKESKPPKLLFSDIAYGEDVLDLYEGKIEGLEGVAFGADPESGFEVSYKVFFGESPTTGEAQLYDAAMLLGYAAWYQYLHPGISLQNALRTIVTGEDINMGSWTGEDMSLVVSALEAGALPYVRGASGPLRFDSKIFTNVLTTTYYNYYVYQGKYVILDYNSSSGSNRTDATLAGWNWKISGMQDFNSLDDAAVYPELKGNWALLVAASAGWSNYRHQADVMAVYQQLKRSGFTDDRIILIAEDDIADHEMNPEPGVMRISYGGENVYEDVEVDYRLSDLSPSDFLSILAGEKSERLPLTVESGPEDNVFVFWSGHGVPGALCWGNVSDGIGGEELAGVFNKMHDELRYRKLIMLVEACYSGGVMETSEGVPGMLFITAARADETSKADNYNGDLRVWMSNRFTSTLLAQISENPAVSLRDLYYRLFINTVGSHVMVYNAPMFGNLYSSDMAEFIIFK